MYANVRRVGIFVNTKYKIFSRRKKCIFDANVREKKSMFTFTEDKYTMTRRKIYLFIQKGK